MSAPFLDSNDLGYPITKEQHFTTGSGSVTAPFNGKLFLRCRGPGATGSSSTPGDGGASGAYCDKLVASVTSGETWNYVVGTGNSGTASTITGPGSVVALVANAAGGVATGGNNNFTGAAGSTAGSNNGGAGGSCPNGTTEGPYKLSGAGGSGGGKKSDGNPGQVPGGGGGGPGKSSGNPGAGANGDCLFVWEKS